MCKHAFAVEYTITKTLNKDGSTTITETKKTTYRKTGKLMMMLQSNKKRFSKSY